MHIKKHSSRLLVNEVQPRLCLVILAPRLFPTSPPLSPSLPPTLSPSLPFACALTRNGMLVGSVPGLHVLAQRLHVFGSEELGLDLSQTTRHETASTRQCPVLSGPYAPESRAGCTRGRERERERECVCMSGCVCVQGNEVKAKEQGNTGQGEKERGRRTLSLHAVSSLRSNLCTSLS